MPAIPPILTKSIVRMKHLYKKLVHQLVRNIYGKPLEV